MEISRLPRFKRVLLVERIELTARDRDIIQHINRHRFLRSAQIVALVGGSSQQTVRRLQLLYHHGYLERPRCQLDYYYKPGSRHIVYGLGDKGAALLGRSALPLAHPRSAEKNRKVGRVFLEHRLSVSDVMVTLELASRNDPTIRLLMDDVLPITKGKSRPSMRWNVSIEGGRGLGIIPDRIFGLQLPDGERAFFFLEADRGTMPVIRSDLSQTSMYRKFLAYAATWKQSIHTSHFGFHRFRVLIVTTGAERIKSMVDACSSLKYGHNLFLFADATQLTDTNILTLQLQTGLAGTTSTLLD